MRHIQRLARIGIDERHQHHPGALASGSGPAAAGRENSQLAAPRSLCWKMGRLAKTYRRARDAVGLRSCATGVAGLETSLC